METLDLKDKKILYALEQESRQSLSKIAKRVRLKKETIFHRIKNLERTGIIKGYLTEIDIYKLGYQFFPVLLRYQNTTPKIENEIYQYILQDKHTAWLTKCEGAWDVNLTLIFKGNYELNRFLNKFLGRYGKYIADKHVFITTEIHYFKRGFWLGKPTIYTVSTGGQKTRKVSNEELKILRILARDARKPLVEIGEKVNMSPRTVAYKIKKLEEEKVIQGSRILVDFTKMGYKFYKIWFSLKNMNKENLGNILAYSNHHPNIIWATKTIGYYDLSIEMEVKNVQEFRNIVDEIKKKFSHCIKKHESLLIFEEGTMNYLTQ